MQPLIWDRRPSGLRAPAMVCAFRGWNDAGEAASSAVSFLVSALHARRFAAIDSEEFYDFQDNRPCVRFDESGQREITWPGVEVLEAPAPRAPRDLVLVRGVEPSMRWRAFSSSIVDLAEDRKSTRLNSSHSQISYAVFCLKTTTSTLPPSGRWPAASDLAGSAPTRRQR